MPWLGIYFVILAPVVGGLIYGPLIQLFAPEARGHGVPEVMLAVAERGGKIRPQVAVVKSLASAICIGAGGSVGREGPIVQIGSALGSSIGQVLHVSENRLRLLVACGTAAGISATFNAPIAGVFFALELILQDFAVDAFGAVVLASVVADVIGRAAFGSQAFLTLPAFHIVSTWEFGLYAILGVLGGLAGLAFIRVLYGTEDLLDHIWHGPDWLRPVAGGVLLGLLLLALPELYGVGYPVLQNAVAGQLVLGLLLLLLVGKMLATSLTIGIGGSGGVFAPSLFMGAMLGTAFGLVANMLFHGAVAPAGAYGLVGMGAVFAGAARAPITAVIIIFELTGDYTIILPLMVAIVAAAGLSSLLSKDTIYTLKLRRRGIDILRSRSSNLMHELRVRDAMQPVPEPIVVTTHLDDLVGRFARRDVSALPVVDVDGGYRGVVTAEDVETALGNDTSNITAGDLANLAAAVCAGCAVGHRALTVRPGRERRLCRSWNRVASSSWDGSPIATFSLPIKHVLRTTESALAPRNWRRCHRSEQKGYASDRSDMRRRRCLLCARRMRPHRRCRPTDVRRVSVDRCIPESATRQAGIHAHRRSRWPL